MADSPQLLALIRKLRTVRSPVGRVRLLARSWRTVRSLSPANKREIAARFGLKGIEEILERLGKKRGGIVPSDLLKALDLIDEQDPTGIEQIIDVVRDSQRRREPALRALDVPESRLEGDDDLQEAEDPERSSEEKRTARAAPAMAPDPPPASAVLPETATPDTLPAASVLPETAASPGPPVPREVPTPVPTSVPAAMLHVARKPQASSAAATPPAAPVATSKEAPAVDLAPAGARDLEKRLEAAPSLIVRFRILSGFLVDRPRLDDPDEIRSALALFPAGWPRRRALASILKSGSPDDLDVALALIGELGQPSDRRWCSRTLLHSREMSEEDRSQIRGTIT